MATIAEAEEKVAEGAFEVAVVDMNLRGDFSHAIAEKLKAAGIPFIVATGYNQNSLPDELKAVLRLEKPFSPQEVIEVLSGMRPKPPISA